MRAALLLTLLLVGCSKYVTSEDIERAAAACAPHQGTSYIFGHESTSKDMGWLEFRCKDGTIIEQHRGTR